MKKKILVILSFVFLLGWLLALSLDEIKNKARFRKEYPSVNLVAWWDIMLSRGIGRWARLEWYWRVFTWDNYNPLTQYDCYQSWDCILFFNLESMFSEDDNDQPKGWFSFRANTNNLQYLRDLRKENDLILSLANNHTSNAGWAGMRLTHQVLDEEWIAYIWAWNNTEEAQEIKKIEKNWISLCFQSFSYDGTAWMYYGESLVWNPLNLDSMKETLSWMNALLCDVKILNLHWWAEYHFSPYQWQRDLAYELIDAWADIILGWHSHVPGPYEEYNGKPIFYSFGNMIFDQDRWRKSAEFDFIYDFELKRRTVPTYIPLLAWLKITKYWTWIEISQPEFKMARVSKGIYSPMDEETFEGIMSEISF